MNPTESAELLAVVCDVLLPGDGNYPRASLTGTHGIVATRLRERYGNTIFASLARDLAQGERGFTQLSNAERCAALTRLQSEKSEFFGYLLMAAYLAYYATPPVIEAIRLDGHIYNDAPQPLGYDLIPFSFTPGVDVPMDPKGSYKWTEEIERIDLSGLAGLDLPVAGERS